MYHLATIFPGVRRFRIPITRDQAMLLVVVMNEVFLGLEHYLAHMISGTLRPNEMIPILFGPISGALLFIRGAPFLAPMLFADMGMIGLVVLLNPKERKEETSE